MLETLDKLKNEMGFQHVRICELHEIEQRESTLLSAEVKSLGKQKRKSKKKKNDKLKCIIWVT